MSSNKNYPPGPLGSTLFSGVRSLRQANRLGFLMSNCEKYGDIVHFNVFTRHIYQLNDPEMIQYVLVKHPEQFNKTPTLKNTTRKSIGQGLLTSDGNFHKRQRRLVQPAFHHNRIASYADVMVDYTAQMLHGWQNDTELDIHHEMMKLTIRIVGKTLFDADVSNRADSIGEAITVGIQTAGERIGRPFHLPDWIPSPANRERRHAARVVEDTVMGFIRERRASGEDKGDLLSMLLMAADEEDGSQMSNRQVRDECMTLFIAGHETTANALAWAFYLLAQHPEAEAKLVEELETVLIGRRATFNDLPLLPYTQMVIEETMRLYPPAWIVSRQAMEVIELGGYQIPKGSILLMSQYVMHHHPKYWDEPESFNPERFSPGWEDRVPKYAYFPFGGGPRICIGNQFAQMEGALLLATIAQRYHISLVPGQNILPDPIITLRPSEGIWLHLAARETVTPDLIAISA